MGTDAVAEGVASTRISSSMMKVANVLIAATKTAGGKQVHSTGHFYWVQSFDVNPSTNDCSKNIMDAMLTCVSSKTSGNSGTLISHYLFLSCYCFDAKLS